MMDYSKEMKSCQTIIVVLAVLLLSNSLPLSEAQNLTDPCHGVDCGQGQCAPDLSLTGYKCNCNSGWTQIVPMFPFLSCFIPNCTLSFSCDNTTAPAPSPVQAQLSAPTDLFPPLPSLSWCGIIPGICGSGDCVDIPATGIGLPSYKCDCHQGSGNLLNQTTGPCLPSCGLSGSCTQLGFPLTSSRNGTNNAPSPSSNEGFSPSPTPSTGAVVVELPYQDRHYCSIPVPRNDFFTVNSSTCAHVDCWKGTCAPAINFPWLPQYSCNCERGWSNLLNLSYLSCGVPNCEVSNPSCGILNHPRSLSLPSPQDILKPCALSLCGDGTCVSSNKTGIFGIQMPSYNCICSKGASNLLNNSAGLCLPDNCIPQCLGLGGTQPPSTEEDPFDNGPFALSPDDTYSATTGRRHEARLGYTIGVLALFLSQSFGILTLKATC